MSDHVAVIAGGAMIDIGTLDEIGEPDAEVPIVSLERRSRRACRTYHRAGRDRGRPLRANDDSILTSIEAGASGYQLKAAPQEEIAASIRSVACGEVALALRAAAIPVGQVRAPAPTLTSRETEVLALVAHGWSNPEIGAHLS